MILFSLLLFFSVSVQAQMVDTLGSLSLDSVLTQQSTQQVSQGLNSLKRVNLIQDIQNVIIEIRTTYFGNYSSINKNNLLYKPFKGINWDIGSDNSSEFFIKLNNINQSMCQYLVQNRIDVKSIFVNNSNKLNCSSSNNIKLVFE